MTTNLKTRTTNLNKITRTRRPLATVPRIALTALLTLAPATVLALGAVGVVAPGVASAASCSPVLNAPMASWVWTGQALYVVPEGESGSNAINVPMPSGVTYPASWMSQPLDNPAPLEWLYANGSKYGIPTSNLADLFGSCTSYTPALVTKMTSEGFSPSMVGGVNPAGMSTTTSGTTKPTQPTSPSQPTTKPTTPSGVTPTSGGSTSTSSTSPSPTQPAAPPVTAPSPTAWQRYLTVLKSDQSIVTAEQSPPSPPPTGSPVWPYVLGGAVVVAGVVATVIRRRTPKSLDEINQDWGGHRGGR